MGYRCFTIHFFFKIIVCKEYENEQEYICSEIKLDRAIILDCLDTEDKYIEYANKIRVNLAKQWNVPSDNVVLLTRDEYEAITDEDSCL